MTHPVPPDNAEALDDGDTPISAAQGLEASDVIKEAQLQSSSPNVPSEYMQDLTRDRKKAAWWIAGLAFVVIAVVNFIVLRLFLQVPAFDDPTMYEFWFYVVWKLGLVTVDIAATYFAVRLMKVAERLYLPLILDDTRMRALQGTKKEVLQLKQSDLIGIIRSISRL